MSRRRAVTLAAIMLVVGVGALVTFHRGGQWRGRLVSQKLRGELPAITWPEITVRMFPAVLRPRIRAIVGPSRGHWIRPLDFPADSSQPWRMYEIFTGATACMAIFRCHVSVLQAGMMPHAVHQHTDEELVIPLSGEIDIVREDPNASRKQTAERIAPGQFVYYAADAPHTHRGVAHPAATYLVFKWGGGSAAAVSEPPRASSSFRFDHVHPRPGPASDGFAMTRIFEMPTRHLSKLHCHVSTLEPGAGYPPHSDPYDIALFLVSGTVETLDQQVEAPSVVFYSADKPHGMRNIGATPAKYVVFEFHCE